MIPTHEVINQPPEFDYNLYEADMALSEAVSSFGGNGAAPELASYGETCRDNLHNHSALANRNKPQLRTFDRFGHRLNSVEFHPSYHKVMNDAVSAGLPSSPWASPGAGAHVERAAHVYMHCQSEQGTTCPTTMTFSAVPALRQQPDIGDAWIKGILSRRYDSRNIPWYEKDGLTIGMAMTEKQGGSDVRANQSTAVPVDQAGPGKPYLLTGHKWFCSAPMSDGFLVLANTDAGIGCFLMPRWTPEGKLNNFYIQRLKDKLGNWSNASSEIEFQGAYSWLLGEDGRGINTILEMVAMTRFDCMLGSSSLMRQALSQAMHHCNHRKAFGKRLIEQPLMVNVLADLCLESEAALLLSMRVAQALDNLSDSFSQQLIRGLTPVGKFWICKRTPNMVYECMECLGGSGYVEESIMPQLFRESPLNSIWEGCGNIQCLDVLRAIGKSPECADALLAEIETTKGESQAQDQLFESLHKRLKSGVPGEPQARRIATDIARLMSASLMIRHSSTESAAHFIETRIEESHGIYGNTPSNDEAAATAILKRAFPVS